VRVIAGEYRGAKGAARTFTPVTLLDANLKVGGTLSVAVPATHNAMAIVTTGRVTTQGRSAGAGELILFNNDGDEFQLSAEEAAHVLVLAGEPLNEPIVAHGPFVMNTREEIYRAMVDFEAGKFGDIPE
jgi:redox-sensitive bicupin YhaK (pirin superfamily)